MPRATLSVAALEFEKTGQTIWIHGTDGGTVLRIKCTGKINVTECLTAPTAHGDILVEGDIDLCIPRKVKKAKR